MSAGNPFATADMAEGYAKSRPAVHAHILERAHHLLQPNGLYSTALDVGCGAGISTKPLLPLARHCIGIEPAESMLQWATQTAPGADFLVGSAESLPMKAGSIDLITAAGSLNYVDLGKFFIEAVRVLTDKGTLIIYDFSQGRSFRDSDKLDHWFESFVLRYPPPRNEAKQISPESLAAMNTGFRMLGDERCEITLPLGYEFYVGYMMTETNVAFAIRSGIPPEQIRAWCAETLRPVFADQPRDVLFHGYLVCMAPR